MALAGGFIFLWVTDFAKRTYSRIGIRDRSKPVEKPGTHLLCFPIMCFKGTYWMCVTVSCAIQTTLAMDDSREKMAVAINSLVTNEMRRAQATTFYDAKKLRIFVSHRQ